MTNYICINGKKAELTEEQMKALGIELPKAKSPFERVEPFYEFCFINSLGEVDKTYEGGTCDRGSVDDMRFAVANYCTDKAIMEQRALHETLNRLLWRYSMEHDGDKIDWSDENNSKWYIFFAYRSKRYDVAITYNNNYLGVIYFHTADTAKAAIKEIIEPFMKAHPEFKW